MWTGQRDRMGGVGRDKEAKAAEAAAKEEGFAAREPVGMPWEVRAKEVEDEFWKAVGDVDHDGI